MLRGIFQSLIMFLVVVIFYITDVVLLSQYEQKRKATGSGMSLSFTITMIIVSIFVMLQPVVLPMLGLYIAAWWGLLLQSLGIFLALIGLWLHWWSRSHLKQFYAERVEVQPEHQLIDTGPYTYVRHPMFTSYFMLVIGFLLINPSVPTLILMIYTFWDFTGAAKSSEELLSRELPGYTEYMEYTSRFLPRLRKR